MQINPSYGVLPSVPENAEVKTTKVVVHADNPRQETAIDEDYELIDGDYYLINDSTSIQSQASKKKLLTHNVSGSSNDYEVQYI